MPQAVIALLLISLVIASDAVASADLFIAKPTRVIDGDTVKVTIPLLPESFNTISIRLQGINTAEMHGSACEKAAAYKAKRFTENFMLGYSYVLIKDAHYGKWAGRIIADICLDLKGVRCLSQELLDAGLAVPYDGKTKRKPWCSND